LHCNVIETDIVSKFLAYFYRGYQIYTNYYRHKMYTYYVATIKHMRFYLQKSGKQIH